MKKSMVFSATAALLISMMAFAQEPPAGAASAQEEGEEDQIITVDVDLVNLVFTVTDRRGRLYTGLTEDDFRVFEDDVLQSITNFDAETNLPLTIALLVDTSGSIRDKLRFEQEAAIEFFFSTLQPDRDRAMLVSFDSGVDLLQDFTDDPNVLAEAVREIRAGGGTSLYDAIYLAVSEKMATQPEGRRILIVISDGDDNASRTSMTETLEMAQKNNVAIYTISTNSTANFQTREQVRGDRVLRQFAEETGGRAFFPFKLEELAVNFENISEELRAQYTLAYIPTNSARDGSFREIRVEPIDGDYEVKARRGYYAPLDDTSENR